MVKAIYDQLKSDSLKHGFTVGIVDDLTNTSIDYNSDFSIEKKTQFVPYFMGLVPMERLVPIKILLKL